MAHVSEFIQRTGTTGTITYTGVRAVLSQNHVRLAISVDGEFANVPQGDGYAVRITHADGTKVTETVAIGAIVDCLGASNMLHWFLYSDERAPAAHTYQLGSNDVWNTVHGGAAREFTANLSADLGCPVAIIDSALPKSAVVPADVSDNGHMWLSGPDYANTVALIDSIGGTVEDVIWAGGEQDALERVSESTYQTDLTQILSNVERDFGAPHIFIQQMGDCNNPRLESYFMGVGQAEQNIAAEYSYVDMGASAVGLPLLNAHHYIPTAYLTLADEMANSIFQYDINGIV
jgi:carbohydrate esterase-like sialic acid-specific acetylesterase